MRDVIRWGHVRSTANRKRVGVLISMSLNGPVYAHKAAFTRYNRLDEHSNILLNTGIHILRLGDCVRAAIFMIRRDEMLN